MIITIIISVCVFLCVIFIKRFGFWEIRDRRSPPEVPGSFPLIGHSLYLGGRPEEVLMKWAKKYGKMFMVNLGPLKTLIIDDPAITRDILNHPSFSGRMQNEVFTQLSQQGHGLLYSEGKTWESQRKFTIKHLRDFGFRKPHMENLVSNEVKELISTLKEYKDNQSLLIEDIFVLPVLNGLWILIAGEKLEQQDARLKNILHEFVAACNNIQTTGIMFAPVLRHIAPSLLGWNRFITAKDALHKFVEEKLADHIKTYSINSNRDLIDCFISEIKQTTDVNSPFYKETGYKNLHGTIADMIVAGSDTTASVVNWTILYLIANPNVQEKLHEEIATVIGTKRSPTLSDRSNLPYTEATICEVLRVCSFAAIGLVRRVLQDTEFNGFTIRKGTLVLANLYSAHYNPDTWNEPEMFRPERFLSPTGERIKNPPEFIPFHGGRRQCLGENSAMDTLFLFTASIFQNFKISPYDKNQKLDLEPIPGLLRIPKPFRVKIQSRY